MFDLPAGTGLSLHSRDRSGGMLSSPWARGKNDFGVSLVATLTQSVGNR